ncbi:MAG: DNA-binding protein [Candidatus Nezhaarchaeales archaeon]
MSEEYNEELEEIRRRRLLEYQRQIEEARRREEERRRFEEVKENVLRSILTPEARSRLINVKIVRPDLAERIELHLMQLAQAQRIKAPLTDEQLKELLRVVQSRKIEWRIHRA